MKALVSLQKSKYFNEVLNTFILDFNKIMYILKYFTLGYNLCINSCELLRIPGSFLISYCWLNSYVECFMLQNFQDI